MPEREGGGGGVGGATCVCVQLPYATSMHDAASAFTKMVVFGL